MNEGADVDTGLTVIKDEWENEEKGELTKGGLLEEQSTVTMTGEENIRITTSDREIERKRRTRFKVNLVVHLWEVFNQYKVVK